MRDLVKKQLESFKKENENRARLLIKCPDQPGIVSAVSTFLYENKANIIESSQYSSHHDRGTFFLRMEFEIPELSKVYKQLANDFEVVAKSFKMEYSFRSASHLKRTAIFVSKEPHCLLELLWEYQSGNLMMDIVMVISNHEDTRETVEALGIPFYYIPANKDIRQQVEEQQIKMLKEKDIEVIVLARYMQILTDHFVNEFPNQIINIHHSFLPAFIGARPYERAYERGVKLIGATSHYVTSDLDEGPIIEQDTKRVDHRDTVERLKKIGHTIERSVLARALRWHLEDRVIVEKNKTIRF
ncbi:MULTISPECIES: formyltetrahydrofolate deformylase [Bacillus]|uniref:formyltetrahydrofolate deformylase n=1 Tax=Bacillus TaxID=1386 RepID=UPI0002FEF387|nr:MULTISPECIES: formyltetrahydrofolate deformylase [Bacillus]